MEGLSFQELRPEQVFLTQDLGQVSLSRQWQLLGGSRTVAPLTSSSGYSPFLRPQCLAPWAVLFLYPRLQPPALEDQLSTLLAPVIISSMTMLEKLSDTYTCFSTENGNYLYVLHLVSVPPWGHVPLPLGSSDGPTHASSSPWTSDSFRRQMLHLSKIRWDLTPPPATPICPRGAGWHPSGSLRLQFGECLFIAINGDRTEGRRDLRQKLCVLKYLFECTSGWWLWMDSSSERSESWGTGRASRGLGEAAAPTLPLLLPGTCLGSL